MDLKTIRHLTQLFERSTLTALEVCEGESRIRMERSAAAQPVPVPLPQPKGNLASEQSASPLPKTRDEAVDFNRLTEVKAPMIGIFYAAPSPDAAPYVRRGDRVKKGDVLCLIEAMKLLNEIVAETDGEIADVCVQNGELVEYAQTLFKLF